MATSGDGAGAPQVGRSFVEALTEDELATRISELTKQRYSRRNKTRTQMEDKLMAIMQELANKQYAADQEKTTGRGQPTFTDTQLRALTPMSARKLVVANINKALALFKTTVPDNARKPARLKALVDYLKSNPAPTTDAPVTGSAPNSAANNPWTSDDNSGTTLDLAARMERLETHLAKIVSRMEAGMTGRKTEEPDFTEEDLNMPNHSADTYKPSYPAGTSTNPARIAVPLYCEGPWYSAKGLPAFATENLLPVHKLNADGYDWDAAGGYRRLDHIQRDVLAMTPPSGRTPSSLPNLQVGATALVARRFPMVPTVQCWTLVVARHMRQHRVFPNNATDATFLDRVLTCAPPPAPKPRGRVSKRQRTSNDAAPAKTGKFPPGSCSVHPRSTTHDNAHCVKQGFEKKQRTTTTTK